ncbi:MAG: RHS repeat-associated core domain-containing protein, partial [Paracoccaceae bacterium]
MTLTLGPVEIRKYGQGNSEAIQLYPHPAIRIQLTKNAGGTVVTTLGALFTDARGSVRAVTRGTGATAQRSVFRPYGEEVTQTFDTTLLNETKGYVGQRFDEDAGLLYLNARYYDPKLGMFVQPDWWEVAQPRVGTNRYGYSFNDPVNGSDPGGHEQKHERPDSEYTSWNGTAAHKEIERWGNRDPRIQGQGWRAEKSLGDWF